MLSIRQAQLNSMSAARQDALFDRVLRRLRTERREIVQPMRDDEIRHLFDSSVSRSRSFGLHSETHIACMTEASVLLGDRFEERNQHEWAMTLLRSRRLDPDQRAALLLVTATRIRAESETK